MDKEAFAISCFNNEFIGDDGAVVGNFVYAKDLFVEGTHFLKHWLSLEQIGYKSMMVNISDIIVMNALPKYALLGLGIPKNTSSDDIKSISNGINIACKEYGVKIIGGDTIASDKIFISLTLIGELKNKPIFRKNLQTNDFLAFTGSLGDSLKGLRSLLNKGSVGKKSRFTKPILKDKFFYKASKFINSSMDISDGLGLDLEKLCLASRKGVKFIKKLNTLQIKSGEEYEILFSFSAKNLKKIIQISKQTRTKITIFAKATKGRYKSNARKHHF
ncbi:thiamine-phosphate kinase [Campylobacter pinnipediorum]|uniref:thiamine-phosphate kinase n=1 Tax=Campylobacter pinnipediorum TaxID=1965231 RepID=UPI00084D5886|nr:thiamine-phosphate kinase [Campylobacter pinnipediorum]